MARKITKEILKNFLQCKYKSHLNLTGMKGINSDFEKMLIKSRPPFKQAATRKFIANSPESDILYNVSLTKKCPKPGDQMGDEWSCKP